MQLVTFLVMDERKKQQKSDSWLYFVNSILVNRVDCYHLFVVPISFSWCMHGKFLVKYTNFMRLTVLTVQTENVELLNNKK